MQNNITNQPRFHSHIDLNGSYQTPSAPPFSPNNFIENFEEEKLIETYMIWSIMNNLLCICSGVLILACSVPALIFSMKTDDYIKMGNFSEARLNSKYAFGFNAAGTTFLFLILLVVFYVYGVELKNETISFGSWKF
jgi:hypothetical protein